jgi:hypothetical protein
MTAETIKLQLTRSAIERLFADNPEVEIQLRKQACNEIVSKHFKELANEELWKLSHSMTEFIAKEVEKVVKGYEIGDKEPCGRWKWYNSYPTSDRVDNMIVNACEKYFTDRTEDMAKKAVESMSIGDESFEQYVERVVKRIIRTQIEESVKAEVKTTVDKVVQDAIAERSVKLKVVQE